MAGRVYLCTIAALVMATAHVKAFFLPPMVAPLVHPGLVTGMPFGVPFFGNGFRKVDPPRTKPLSRPFTWNDVPGANFGGSFGVGLGAVQLPALGAGGGGGLFMNPTGGLFGGDVNVNGLIGGGGVGVGGLIGIGNGLAASTNDLNSLTLAGVVDPLDARNNLEISDSRVLLNNAGIAGVNGEISDSVYMQNPGVAGLNAEISDSNVLVKNSVGGGLPTGSVMATY